MRVAVSLDEAEKLISFNRQFADIASGFSLRFSARFMHPRFTLLRQHWLTEKHTFPLKTLCVRPVQRGVQPEYDDGETYVVKTGTLRNGGLDWSDAQTVNETFFE